MDLDLENGDSPTGPDLKSWGGDGLNRSLRTSQTRRVEQHCPDAAKIRSTARFSGYVFTSGRPAVDIKQCGVFFPASLRCLFSFLYPHGGPKTLSEPLCEGPRKSRGKIKCMKCCETGRLLSCRRVFQQTEHASSLVL